MYKQVIEATPVILGFLTTLFKVKNILQMSLDLIDCAPHVTRTAISGIPYNVITGSRLDKKNTM